MENKKTTHMFKMKRIIAVALIMMLLPIIPIQAGYAECSHEREDPVRLMVDSSYKQNDSSTHKATYTYYVYCADCRAVIRWETENVTEAHNFNKKGVCKSCGYEQGNPPCTHTKTKDVLISTYSKSNNESTHTTYWNYNVVCKSCSEIMDSYTDHETEKHTFNSKGVCTVCNYKKGTTEEKVCKVYGNAHKLSHEEFEAEHPHLIYKKCDCGYTEYTGGKKDYYSECKICNPQECPVHGKHKLDGAVMFEKEHPHRQYVVCDCGYAKYTGGNKDYYSECDICNPKVCQHSSTEKKVYYDEYVAKDSQYHSHNYYYDVVCSLCGEKLKSPMGNDKEAHTFNKNDVCTLCGYSLDKPCTHQNTREELASQTAKSLNDSQHELISTYNVICKSCKEKIDTVTRTTKAAHVFDAAGDCEVCGYRKGCQHTSSKRVKIGSGYDVIDASTHQYYVVYNRVCANSACGKVLEYNIIETSNQAHSFSGNKCTACGYEKAEELSVSISRNRSSATVGEYIGASAAGKGGTGSYQYAWKATCNGGTVANGSYGSNADWGTTASKAGNWVITVTLKDTNTGKTVSASTSGITVKERECTHVNTEDTLIDTKYIKQSDSTHIIRRYYSRICVDCGTVLNASFYKDNTAEHSFNASGQCVCGFTKASCKHDQGSHQEYVSSRLEQINSGNEHKKVTVYRIICDQCSATINASTEVTSIEPHSFNGTGVCACGYAKPTKECDHANRVNEQIGNPTYVINSEKVHTKTVKVRVKCADCGIKLESEKISTSVEKHKFVNGICACGQKEHVHSYEKVIIGQPKYVNQNTNEHDVTITYVMKCSGCGDTTAQQTETIREAHTWDLFYEENGIWYQKCSNCGLKIKITAPENNMEDSEITELFLNYNSQTVQKLPDSLQQTSKEFSDINYGNSNVGTAACGLFALLNITQYDQGTIFDRESVKTIISEMKGTTNKDGLSVAMAVEEIPVHFGEGKNTYYYHTTKGATYKTGSKNSDERKSVVEEASEWLNEKGNYLILSTTNKNLRSASKSAADSPHFIAVVGMTAEDDFIIMDSTASYNQTYYYEQILDEEGKPTGYGILKKDQIIGWSEVAVNFVTIDAPQKEVKQLDTKTSQQILSESASQDGQVMDNLIDFVKVDSYSSQSNGSTLKTTSDAAKKNWDSALFRVAVIAYEEVPKLADPIGYVADLAGEAAFNSVQGETLLGDRYNGWTTNQKEQLAIEMVEEALLQKRFTDENQFGNALDLFADIANEVPDVATLMGYSPNFYRIVGSMQYDNGYFDHRSLASFAYNWEKGVETLRDISDGMALINELYDILIEQERDREIVYQLVSEYGKNVYCLEEIGKNSGSTIKKACEMIKEEMDNYVAYQLENVVTNALSTIGKAALNQGVSLKMEAMETLFPEYKFVADTGEALANGAERQLNRKFKTQEKIDASKLLLLMDQLAIEAKPNFSPASLGDESFLCKLQMYYTVMEHKFDAAADYLNADDSTRFQLTYLEEERKAFEESYQNLINSYYESGSN